MKFSSKVVKNLTHSFKFQTVPGLLSDYSFAQNCDDLGSTYICKLENLCRQPLKPINEAIKVAKKIYQLADIPLGLCLSSGIDSQSMLDAFLKANIPFKVYVLKFKNKFNEHDTNYIIQYCNDRNLSLNIVDIDIIDFFESGKYLDFANKYHCQSPQLATHLWLLDQIDDLPILSGNFPVPINLNGKIFWHCLPGDLHSTLFRYFTLNSRSGEPWFFINSSELAASFLHLNCLEEFLKLNVNHHNNFLYRHRYSSYYNGGFYIKPQKYKTTGFELVRKYYDEKLGTTFGTGFDSLFRRPLEYLNPFANDFYQLVPKNFLKKCYRRYSKTKWMRNYMMKI